MAKQIPKNKFIIKISAKNIDRDFQQLMRKMGLASDQEGIYNRYLREREAWQEHLERTKKFITDFLPGAGGGSVSVLGSGWMLDIPAQYLLDNFREVIFYDVRHPEGIIKKYADHPGARFISLDLTGGILKQVYQLCKKQRRVEFPEIISLIESAANFRLEETDYYLSVNLLNQLDILLVDYLLKRAKLKPGELQEIRRLIQEQHIKLLPPGSSCLITDYEEIQTDRSGLEKSSTSLLHTQLPDSSYQEEWIWLFDNHKTYHPRWRTKFKVKAIRF